MHPWLQMRAATAWLLMLMPRLDMWKGPIESCRHGSTTQHNRKPSCRVRYFAYNTVCMALPRSSEHDALLAMLQEVEASTDNALALNDGSSISLPFVRSLPIVERFETKLQVQILF